MACPRLVPSVVTRLSRPPKVVGGEPGAVGCQGTLTPKELVALIEPIQGINGAVVGLEL
jgi:hypothetical protein